MKLPRFFRPRGREAEPQPVPDTLLVFRDQFEAAGIVARCPSGGLICNIVLSRTDYDPVVWDQLVAIVRPSH